MSEESAQRNSREPQKSQTVGSPLKMVRERLQWQGPAYHSHPVARSWPQTILQGRQSLVGKLKAAAV